MIGAGFMGKAYSLAYAMAPIAHKLPAGIRRQVVINVTEELAGAAAPDFNYRRVPAITYARQLVETGRIGTPYQSRINYRQDWGCRAWRSSGDSSGRALAPASSVTSARTRLAAPSTSWATFAACAVACRL